MTELDVRIYYEDTDYGGVVYYANYLKYMERGRTEYLRSLGFEQSNLAQTYDVLFAVTQANISYLSPARFDDLLTVHTTLDEARGARMNFKQQIFKGDILLVEGDIFIACMSKENKAKRIPAHILECIDREKK